MAVVRILQRSIHWGGLAAGVAMLIGPAPAEARLVNQFLRGMDRVCIYDNPTGQYTNRLERSLTVPAEEDCPAEPRLPVIPSLATLLRDSSEGGQRVCTYTYLDRNYVRLLAVGQVCPYTPM